MKSFVCPLCSAESFSMHDVVNRYCGRCHVYVDDYLALPPRMTPAEQKRIEEMLKGSKDSSGMAPEAQWIRDHPHGEKS
jgi:hypothetical protein